MNEFLKVLVIDDEENILWLLKEGLENDFIEVLTTTDTEQAANILEREHIDVCLVDIFLDNANGIELVDRWKGTYFGVNFIIMTAQNTSSNVINSINAGALDFFPKPFDLEKLQNKILEICKKTESESSVGKEFVYDFQTSSQKMLDIYKLIGRIAKTNINVLIQGETGTGKEVLARMIYEKSNRSDKPFVAINMPAIPDELMESELFGHVKGSFTGAVSDKTGKFEQANGGTIFLDEISELNYSLQSKLLRILQERELNRLGSNKTIKLDLRIIAATNKNLENLIKQEKFREDLYYRLNVVSMDIPPLRERKEDIPFLVNHFLKKYRDLKGEVMSIGEDAMEKIKKYTWPGNIRELENVIQSSIIQSSGSVITVDDLPQKISKNNVLNGYSDSLFSQLYKLAQDIIDAENLSQKNMAFDEFCHITLKPLFEATLMETEGNKSLAAKILGINRNTLRKKLKELNIE
ncbi:MAG: sigma-54-dependent Fis family transcriptional regulator [Flexistipes sinusarabici]|uniref:DNA-binding transcriptional regulator NtrC n=1 Tax=Flexistipes sinusarabici TaxID=2352 RepID=A0A5D0MX21_FLESI|nr:sigma-54 dependent transcriptional regulator [Flexistipes sinusarabici]TYB36693.1 MAG: sigma-54-dependent Fis family transcriptional regulator [Flexistipes sinusarabici]